MFRDLSNFSAVRKAYEQQKYMFDHDVCSCLDRIRRKASGERNGVEATFGTTKRVYRANNIRAKLKETTLTWIAACFFAKNLKKFLMRLLCLLLEKSLRLQQIHNTIATGDYFGKPCTI